MNNAMLSVKDEIVGAIPGFKYPIEETLTPKPTAAAMLATGGRHAEHWGWQGKPYSILIDLPPLSVSGFKLLGNLGVSESTSLTGAGVPLTDIFRQIAEFHQDAGCQPS